MCCVETADMCCVETADMCCVETADMCCVETTDMCCVETTDRCCVETADMCLALPCLCVVCFVKCFFENAVLSVAFWSGHSAPRGGF